MFKFILIFVACQFIFADGFQAYATDISYNPSKYINGTYQLKNVTGGQKVNVSIWLGEDFGNNNKFSVIISRIYAKKTKVIFSLPGTGACSALWAYGGPFAIEIAKAVNYTNPGKCPIKKNIYHIKNFLIRFPDIKLLNMVPNGKYVGIGKYYDITGKEARGDATIHFVKTN